MNKPFAITLDVGSSLLNKTGSWRTERPVYLDRLPPCNNACPAGENIQAWLYHAEEGRYEQAWREIMKNNPFPAVMGRVCYHPCEKACNRVHLDDAVGINSVERFLGDQALREGWQVAPGEDTGKRVMVVGAGPAGLACAYHLRSLGHQVTVYEASAQAGGMVRYGIPKYRMPREKLKAEIRRIEEMGVEIVLNTRIDDIQGFKQANGFDAVFLAIGAQQPKRVEIPSDESIQQLDAVGLLR
ncbi:MAG: FAD-dependent oxidoreductase, partial [Candidatus Thiodiazotropha taylori]|nr:FAD-dependent oxidoreductase [Candidatus Thiodiazotropha taylori]